MYITMPKVDVPQILISSAAVFGIAMVWNNINEKVFRTVYDLLRAPFVDKYAEERRRRRRRRIEEEMRRKIGENFTSDPSSSAMNYVKFTALVASSIAFKQYPEDQKILPTSV